MKAYQSLVSFKLKIIWLLSKILTITEKNYFHFLQMKKPILEMTTNDYDTSEGGAIAQNSIAI